MKKPRVLRKLKFTPSSSVKKLENDSPDALKELLMKTKEKFFSPQPGMDKVEARLEFFENFKMVSQTERRTNLEANSRVAYLQDLSKYHLNPKPFGMIKSKDPESCIDLHFYSMGDEYAHAFAEGLKHFKNLETLNLRSNRLSDKGSYAIMRTLDIQPIRYLSLCDNILGARALSCLFSLLRSPKQCLKHLILDNTRLSSHDIISLASIVTTNKSLRFLSLANNNINQLTIKALKEMLHYNETLKKIDLHWNCLRIEGAVCILEGLQDNSTLQELNLCWNSIGGCRNDRLLNTFCELLGKQANLRHLDLSNNYLEQRECEVLAKEIVKNHRLLVHMNGNECFVDAKGFVVPVTNSNQIKSQHVKKAVVSEEGSVPGTNCWICEKWVQFSFRYTEKSPGPIFIHLECDAYKPEMMYKAADGYFIDRAIPAGKLRFFFSDLSAHFKSSEYSYEVLPEMMELQVRYSETLQMPMRIIYVNFVKSQASAFKKIEEFQSKLREPGLKYNSPQVQLIRIEWKFETSMFKDYVVPSEYDLDDCFEFDWKHSRITSLVKVPLHQTQLSELLKSVYKNIYFCYKYLSALSGYEIFAVGVNVLTENLQIWNALDNLYKVSDLGVNWSACMVTKDKTQLYNPGNSLIRYQFLEILVRIASDRYVRNRICGNIIDATRKFLTETFLPASESYLETLTWRTSDYFCEEIDLVFKAHKEILEAVYKKYSGHKTLPGQKSFMSLEEFRQFARDARLENERLTVREIDLSFVQAMMVQVDEVYQKRHLEMSFVEFLEAFGRCCSIAGPVHKVIMSEKDQIRRLSGIFNKVTLAEIIEAYMPNLLKLCPLAIREGFVFPTSETYKKMMYRAKGP